MIRYFKRVVKIFLILGIVFLASELFLYIASAINNPKHMFSPKINEDDSEERILCIGDSFTYGLGAESNYSYPAQLEKLLNDNNPQKRFKVFNQGKSGLSSSIAANTLEDSINKFNPDFVIILSGCNDHWNLYQCNLPEVLKGQKITKNILKLKINLYKFRTFRLLQLVGSKIINRFKFVDNADKRMMQFSNITDDKLLNSLVEYNYQKIADIINSGYGEIKLFFQTYPTGPERTKESIKSLADQYRVKIVDQADIFSNRADSDSLVANDGWHLNAKGYNLMAKNIYQAFLKEGIINNSLISDINIKEKKAQDAVIITDDGIWEYDLTKIAQKPERLIFEREGTWYFTANNIVDLPELDLAAGEYVLEIKARGTAVDGVYPLLGVYYLSADSDENLQKEALDKIYVSNRWTDYRLKKITLTSRESIKFYISFENDTIEIDNGRARDRNLYVNRITLRSAYDEHSKKDK